MQSRQARVTSSARRDLREIAAFIAQSDPPAAKRYVADLISKLHSIAKVGVEGSARDFLPADVKAFPYRSHCFYFTVDAEFLTLLRVVHGARDLTAIDFGPTEEA